MKMCYLVQESKHKDFEPKQTNGVPIGIVLPRHFVHPLESDQVNALSI